MTLTKTRAGVAGCFILQQNCTSKFLEHGNINFGHLSLYSAGILTEKTIVNRVYIFLNFK